MKKKVLIADYEPKAAGALKTALEAAGFEVETANNGEAALERYHAFQPDAVVIEPMLPKLHGFEVCKKIRSAPKGGSVALFWWTKVYKGRKYQAESKHKFQVAGHLERPLPDAEVAAAVAKALGVAMKTPAAAAPPPATVQVVSPPPAAAAPAKPKPAPIPEAPMEIEAVDTMVVPDPAKAEPPPLPASKPAVPDPTPPPPPAKKAGRDLSKAKASLKDTLANLKRSPRTGSGEIASPYGVKKGATLPPGVRPAAEWAAPVEKPPAKTPAATETAGGKELWTTQELFGDLIEDAEMGKPAASPDPEIREEDYRTKALDEESFQTQLAEFDESLMEGGALEDISPEEEDLFTSSDEEAAPTQILGAPPAEETPDLSTLDELEGAVEGEDLATQWESGSDEDIFTPGEIPSESAAAEGDDLFTDKEPAPPAENLNLEEDVNILDSTAEDALDSLLDEEAVPSFSKKGQKKNIPSLIPENPTGEGDSPDIPEESIGGMLDELPSDEAQRHETPGPAVDGELEEIHSLAFDEDEHALEFENEGELEEIPSVKMDEAPPAKKEPARPPQPGKETETSANELDFGEEAAAEHDTAQVSRDEFMAEYSGQGYDMMDFVTEEEDTSLALASPGSEKPSPPAKKAPPPEEFKVELEEPSREEEAPPPAPEEKSPEEDDVNLSFHMAEDQPSGMDEAPEKSETASGTAEEEEWKPEEAPSMTFSEEELAEEAPASPPQDLFYRGGSNPAVKPPPPELPGESAMRDLTPSKIPAAPAPQRGERTDPFATRPKGVSVVSASEEAPARAGGHFLKIALAIFFVGGIVAGGAYFFMKPKDKEASGTPAVKEGAAQGETGAVSEGPETDLNALEEKPKPLQSRAPLVPPGVRVPPGTQVFVSVHVDEKGRVTEASTVLNPTGSAELATAAEEAVKGWVFSPGRKDGRAVEVRMTVPVRFREE